MVKRKSYRRYFPRRRRGRAKRKIPIIPIVGLAAGFIAPQKYGESVIDAVKAGRYENALANVCLMYTGYNPYDGQWNIADARGLQIFLGSLVVSKALGWLGANRMFSKLPSPLNKLSL